MKTETSPMVQDLVSRRGKGRISDRLDLALSFNRFKISQSLFDQLEQIPYCSELDVIFSGAGRSQDRLQLLHEGLCKFVVCLRV